MKKFAKLAITAAAFAGYFLTLRYVAPSQEPYFIIGIALIGFIALLYGIFAGLIATVLLIPATYYIYSQFEISTSYDAFVKCPAYIFLEISTVVVLGHLRKTKLALSEKEASLVETNESLQGTLSQVREIGGIYCLCSSCKKILSDNEKWMDIDAYLMEKTKMEFSHGICPDCAEKYQSQPSTPTAETKADAQ